MTTPCPVCGLQNRPGARFCQQCGTNLVAQAPPPWPTPTPYGSLGLTGRLLANTMLANRYIIRAKIGQGGQAAVYDALDSRLHQRVAIKEMSDSAITDPNERHLALARFHQEADMLVRLSHPNLPRVTDKFTEAGKHYLVMDFVDGNTLERILQNANGPLPERQACSWAAQLCEVLAYMHGQNPPVIFRDLKPSNIMIDDRGQVKLIDFGIARLFKPRQAGDTERLGTPGYAAPEQIGGQQSDARTDIYALGVTLHQMLSGQPPPPVLWGPPPPPLRTLNPSISADTENIVKRALERDPNRRWQTTSELGRVLCAQLGISQHSARLHYAPTPVQTGVPGAKRSASPTTKLVTAVAQTVSQWSNQQIALALAGSLALTIALIAIAVPFLARFPLLWNNVMGFAIVAPLVHASVRRNWFAAASHVLIVLAIAIISSIHLFDGSWTEWKLGVAFLGALVSAAVIEAFVRVLPRVRGKDYDEAWRIDLGWLALMSVVATVVYVAIFWGTYSILNPMRWIAAAILGALGRGIGNIIHQSLVLRRAKTGN